PRFHQAPQHVAIDLAAFRLPVRCMRSADVRTFVVVQPKPVQRVQQGEIALLAVALGVGILQPEHEGSAHMTGVGPVEQRRSDEPDVGCARRRRAEPHAYVGAAARIRGRHDFPLRTTGLDNVPTPSMLMLTVSPSSIGPTPSGVPVRMRSPGSSVITAETHSTIAPTSWIISEVRLSCLVSPLTSVRSSTS